MSTYYAIIIEKQGIFMGIFDFIFGDDDSDDAILDDLIMMDILDEE